MIAFLIVMSIASTSTATTTHTGSSHSGLKSSCTSLHPLDDVQRVTSPAPRHSGHADHSRGELHVPVIGFPLKMEREVNPPVRCLIEAKAPCEYRLPIWHDVLSVLRVSREHANASTASRQIGDFDLPSIENNQSRRVSERGSTPRSRTDEIHLTGRAVRSRKRADNLGKVSEGASTDEQVQHDSVVGHEHYPRPAPRRYRPAVNCRQSLPGIRCDQGRGCGMATGSRKRLIRQVIPCGGNAQRINISAIRHHYRCLRRGRQVHKG